MQQISKFMNKKKWRKDLCVQHISKLMNKKKWRKDPQIKKVPCNHIECVKTYYKYSNIHQMEL